MWPSGCLPLPRVVPRVVASAERHGSVAPPRIGGILQHSALTHYNNQIKLVDRLVTRVIHQRTTLYRPEATGRYRVVSADNRQPRPTDFSQFPATVAASGWLGPA